jgi:hypothetical protein
VWGIDQNAYGPVELPALVSWVKDERVTADTWVYTTQGGGWQKAPLLPELQMFFRGKGADGAVVADVAGGVDVRLLRRVKILGGLAEEQLDRFARFVEAAKFPQWSVIVKQGEPGDSMYFVLDGELRVRINVMDKESILATLGIGEFFGDISLFDHGPRSTDVVANSDSLLGRLSAAAFTRLSQEAPEIATPFLLAVAKTLTSRIRADNKRFTDWVKFTRAM